jgi:hypothetical protein
MRVEIFGMVSVLAERAPKIRIIFPDWGRRSVNTRYAKPTRSSRVGEWKKREDQ